MRHKESSFIKTKFEQQNLKLLNQSQQTHNAKAKHRSKVKLESTVVSLDNFARETTIYYRIVVCDTWVPIRLVKSPHVLFSYTRNRSLRKKKEGLSTDQLFEMYVYVLNYHLLLGSIFSYIPLLAQQRTKGHFYIYVP